VPVMLPWVRQAFQPAPLLVGRKVIWSTRGWSRVTTWARYSSPLHPGSPGRPASRWGPPQVVLG